MNSAQMQEILIISNDYPPEIGTAAVRVEQLALKLKQNKYRVTVVCPLGNYRKGELFPKYKAKFCVTEKINSITVKRLWIYPTASSNFFKRTFSALSFLTNLFLYLLVKRTPNTVVVQSPSLMQSFVSVFVLSQMRKKIILNVYGLWPLTAVELKIVDKDSVLQKVAFFVEHYIYSRATLILGQSNEIISHVQSLFPDKKCYLYRNYSGNSFANPALKLYTNEPIKMLYAGPLEISNGLLEICQKINLDSLNIEFHIFGEGAEEVQIKEFIQKQSKKNIFYHQIFDRARLDAMLQNFDVALIPVTTQIYGSVPSEIFEYSAAGLPILYFGDGEGERIVLQNRLGFSAKKDDFESLNDTLTEISILGKNTLQTMKLEVFENAANKFNLDFQIKKLIKEGVF